MHCIVAGVNTKHYNSRKREKVMIFCNCSCDDWIPSVVVGVVIWNNVLIDGWMFGPLE